MNMILDLLEYTRGIQTNKGFTGKQITLYCKPLEVLKNDFGTTSGYKVIKVYEVERYLLGENPATSEEVVFSINEVPSEIKMYFKAQELYGG